MAAYYNEIDPYAAQWLRNLILAGHIAPGEVDERSITDVAPDDLRGFDQCHFFAGIGGWSLALRLAGWPDDQPVWTGSCPCQPFSAAGKGLGEKDPRHLWPEFRRLIAECRPATVFGEQVAAAAGREWLAGVRADLEGLAYGVGAADLCAASAGAPHIRQRLWWVADAHQGQRGRLADGEGREHDGATAGWQQGHGVAESGGADGRLADADSAGQREQRRAESSGGRAACGCGEGGMGDAQQPGLERHARHGDDEGGRPLASGSTAEASGLGSWSEYVWIPCADGKARRIEPGLEPLAHGVSNRVGRLRAYGNAIPPEVGARFIGAVMEI